MVEKRPALGRGLSALIPDTPSPAPVAADRALEVDTDLLRPNKFQPRTQMDDERIEELARSIRSHGIIQPIVVRKLDQGYEIIAGERRWRAAKMAGLLRVPIAVREVAQGGERSLLEMALVENIQRENLNPIEEALAYRRLADEFQMTQEAIASAVGKDRATVSNMIRLLRLPEEVRAEVASGRLSTGHARAILALPNETDQRGAARDVIARSLSVRETESLVKKIAEEGAPPAEPGEPKPVDVHTRAAEDQLRLTLGTRVRIVRQGPKGRIEIDFGSDDERIRLYEQLTARN